MSSPRFVRWALEPFERKNSENSYALQHALQEVMQDLAGIVRQQEEMLEALDRIQKLKSASERVSLKEIENTTRAGILR